MVRVRPHEEWLREIVKPCIIRSFREAYMRKGDKLSIEEVKEIVRKCLGEVRKNEAG